MFFINLSIFACLCEVVVPQGTLIYNSSSCVVEDETHEEGVYLYEWSGAFEFAGSSEEAVGGTLGIRITCFIWVLNFFKFGIVFRFIVSVC